MLEILIILFLIFLNGLFSMSELALVSARKPRLETLARKGSKRARIALDLSNSPTRFLSTVQIGITLIGILTGIYSGKSMTDNLAASYERIHLLHPYSHSLAVATVVLIITFLSLVFGELLPKRIGLTNPEGLAMAMARPMQFLSRVTAPFVWLLTHVTDLFVKLFGVQPSADSRVTEEEIKAIIQEGTEGGEVQKIEQDIVQRVFILGDRKVSSLMTHRSDLVMIQAGANAEAVREMVNRELHSVYPVYERSQDEVTGFLFLKDLFLHLNDTDFSVGRYMSPPQFISENTLAYKALELFKDWGKHFAIVTDEYGHSQGMVTINDLLTALVGNVDEIYKDEYQMQEREDGSFLVDGDYPLHDFLHSFDLSELASEYDYNTISGLLIHELQRIPDPGDVLHWKSLRLEVLDMDGARIDKILVSSDDRKPAN